MSLTEEVWIEIQEHYDDPRIIKILGRSYVYKTIDREEYREALSYSMGSLEKLEDYLCDISLIYPVEIDKKDSYGGLITTISDSILESSGLKTEQIKESRDYYEQELESIDFQMDLIIREVFPEYSLDEIEQWEMDRVIRMYTKAKWVLEKLRNIKISESSSGETEEKQPESTNNYQGAFKSSPKPPIQEEASDFSEKNPIPKSNDPGEIANEEELLKLFGKTKDDLTKIGERLPESAWSNHEDELKGTVY